MYWRWPGSRRGECRTRFRSLRSPYAATTELHSPPVTTRDCPVLTVTALFVGPPPSTLPLRGPAVGTAQFIPDNVHQRETHICMCHAEATQRVLRTLTRGAGAGRHRRQGASRPARAGRPHPLCLCGSARGPQGTGPTRVPLGFADLDRPWNVRRKVFSLRCPHECPHRERRTRWPGISLGVVGVSWS
jgi:hypothetical protein